jgi:hypothetical protein
MVTKADTQYRGDLLQLKLRLDKLGIANATGHHNPLGPSLVCEAFHHGLNQLKASREVEKVCLRVFEQTVLQQLGPLYKELNDILIRHGVLPDLDLSKYLSEQAGAKPEEKTEPAQPEPVAEETAAAEPTPKAEQESARSAQPRRKPGMLGGEFRGYAQAAQTAFATVRNLLNPMPGRYRRANSSASSSNCSPSRLRRARNWPR